MTCRHVPGYIFACNYPGNKLEERSGKNYKAGRCTLSKPKKPISSSPDYPLYERMKRKNPKAALFWLAGDRLYHSGLMLTMLAIPALFFVYTQYGINDYFPWLVVGLVISVGMFFAGIFFKREAYKLAIKDGMDISKPV